MREIKFRAWDEEKQVMFYSCPKGSEGYQLIMYYHSWGLWTIGDDPVCVTSDHDNLMQYTGLKDKNGQDIYEGDILHYTWQSNWGSREKIDRNFAVVFDDGQFLQLEQDEETPDHWYHWDVLEVVGNIHENPDLLTPKENE